MNNSGAQRAAVWLAAAAGLALLVAAGVVGLPWATIGSHLGRMAVPIRMALLGAGLLAVAVVGAAWRQVRIRSVRWGWTVLLIVVPILALTAIGLVVLLGAVPVDQQHPELRVELIKTALSVGAGTGGVVALVLAGRRGWATEHDATERRITELYTKAADQLGSEQAPVRLAGLFALERVAQANPSHRQTIVDVICAYLRMPYTPPGQSPRRVRPGHRVPEHTRPTAAATGKDPNLGAQELHVRLTAQRILHDHLQPDASPTRPRWLMKRPTNSKFWPDVDLDLTDATLIDFDLTHCRLRRGRFDGATFTRRAGFNGARFAGDAGFSGARFIADAKFSGATFTRDAKFSGATFTRGVWFDRATFAGDAVFDLATFAGDAEFSGAMFTRRAEFSGATFTRRAEFSGATFDGYAGFDGAMFTRRAGFRGATFTGNGWFNGATFTGDAGFSGARFAGDAVFGGARFAGDAGFGGARFAGDAVFRLATFTRGVWFDRATFAGDAVFDLATFTGDAEFEGARALLGPSHQWPAGWRLRPWSGDPQWGVLERVVDGTSG